eukprot:UC4_evm2s741
MEANNATKSTESQRMSDDYDYTYEEDDNGSAKLFALKAAQAAYKSAVQSMIVGAYQQAASHYRACLKNLNRQEDEALIVKHGKGIYCNNHEHVHSARPGGNILGFTQPSESGSVFLFEVHYNLGKAYYYMAKSVEALNHLALAIKLGHRRLRNGCCVVPTVLVVPAYLMSGIVCASCGKIDEAFSHFQEAIALDPRNPDCRTLRGLLFGSIRDFSRAFDDLNFAHQLASDDVGVLIVRGTLMHHAAVLASNFDVHAQAALRKQGKGLSCEKDFAKVRELNAMAGNLWCDPESIAFKVRSFSKFCGKFLRSLRLNNIIPDVPESAYLESKENSRFVTSSNAPKKKHSKNESGSLDQANYNREYAKPWLQNSKTKKSSIVIPKHRKVKIKPKRLYSKPWLQNEKPEMKAEQLRKYKTALPLSLEQFKNAAVKIRCGMEGGKRVPISVSGKENKSATENMPKEARTARKRPQPPRPHSFVRKSNVEEKGRSERPSAGNANSPRPPRPRDLAANDSATARARLYSLKIRDQLYNSTKKVKENKGSIKKQPESTLTKARNLHRHAPLCRNVKSPSKKSRSQRMNLSGDRFSKNFSIISAPYGIEQADK